MHARRKRVFSGRSAARRNFATGLEVWCAARRTRRRGLRVALLSHAAAVGTDGVSALDRLWAQSDLSLVAVFTPEHGYWACGGAGEPMPDTVHPLLGIPIYSLYGGRPAPTPEHWRSFDLLIVDLQDLGVRCYTYVSTLRDVLESAAAAGKPVLVADRPCPLVAISDGPMLDQACHSFVGHIPAPFVYGMTIGETARWLCGVLHLNLELQVAPMRGYCADGRRPTTLPWVPPSPGIRTWESAWGYPIGVFSEALPLLQADRGGPLSFQVIAVSDPWKGTAADSPKSKTPLPDLFQGLEKKGLDVSQIRDKEETARAVWSALHRLELPGGRLEFHAYRAEGAWRYGARIVVEDPTAWRPACAAIRVLSALQSLFGRASLWEVAGARPEFFDRLWGTPAIRQMLQAGERAVRIERSWRTAERRVFDRDRSAALLYPR